MAILLSELIAETKKQYKLKLLAGVKGVDVPVNWVHLVEDAAVAPYFWGGELIVTTGVMQEEPDWLLRLAQGLLDRQISGILVNIGMYIHEIPSAVIDYCDEHDLPLLTMPWEIHLSEVIKDYCMRIVMGNQSEAAVAKALMEAIDRPESEGDYLPELQNYFNVNGTFQVLAFRLEFPEGTEISQRLQAADVMRTLLSRTIRKFSLFRRIDFYVLVLNDADPGLDEELARQLMSRCQAHQPPLPIHVGLGDPVVGVRNLSASFRRARAAGRKADYNRLPLVRFREMGIEQLLYTAEDPDVLTDFYREHLGVLEDYDQAHDGRLTETLYQDLLAGGSIKQIAAAMYTHRNTVNYRVAKIRELMQVDLNDPEVRTRCRMAFYIRDILRAIQEKEEREGKTVAWRHKSQKS